MVSEFSIQPFRTQEEAQAYREGVGALPAQAAWMAGLMAPSSGISDYLGLYPEMPTEEQMIPTEQMPSFGENIANKQYLDAILQSAGVLGDAAYASIPFTGPYGAIAGTALKGIGAVGKASKGAKVKGLSSLDRAKEMGFDTDKRVFHGTTHDIKAFDPSKGNIEGYYGDAIYFTDSPVDASKNYAGVGPDLTSRIYSRQEQLINDWASGASKKKTEPFKGAKKYGKDLNIKPEDFDDMDQYFMAIARKELSGGADNVIPAYLKMENPIDLTNKNEGWELITEYDEAGNYVDETGNAIDLYESIMQVANKYNFDGQKLFNDLELYEYKSFREVDDAIRASDEMLDLGDDYGNYASNQAIKEIYQDAGFDGVIMDASDTFINMKNVPRDTKHFIVFEPNQVRSTFAEFDPNKAQSAGLLAGTSALAVGSSLTKEEDKGIGSLTQ